MVQEFHIDAEVKSRCQLVYGREISDRTWRRWKRLCLIHPGSKSIAILDVKKLLALTLLKRQNPYARFDSPAKTARKIWDVMHNPSQKWLDLVAIAPFSSIKPAIQSCRGQELPEVIRQMTGRSVSVRTLYRWGKQKKGIPFAMRRKYDPVQVNWWLNQVEAWAS